MAKTFLLEIGLEEMPAHLVTPSVEQLKDKVARFLDEKALPYEEIKAFSTPRRLAVQVIGLAEKQADVEEEVKGPAKKIAQDEAGNWTKAAEGFVRGQGMTTEDIFFKEIKDVEYVYVKKYVQGQTAKEVLKDIKEVILSLTFPVSMHWANYDLKFIRPIHWLVALLDDEIVPFEILNLATNRISRGHRFLSKTNADNHEFTMDHAEQYPALLAEHFVIADATERKQMITEQIKTLAETNHWQVAVDESLLEEVNNLVEYPTVFAGSFEEKYLEVPEEVLVTSMKEHQRYFEVRNQANKLLPFFISVRNGNDVAIENVVKGNQKVLTARLEDAEFFYQEDQKLTIAECVEKLKQVTFHEKISSVYDKMQRVKKIAQLIGETVGLSAEELADLARASEIYKFDLVTNMVGEFPELQGIMGEKYALLQGEKPTVAKAIREHYLPNSSDGELPESKIGAVLAIADKLDSVLTFFAAEMIPSGSNDPYALRRQAYGIIRIVADQDWSLPLSNLHSAVKAAVEADLAATGLSLQTEKLAVLEFIKGRMKQWLTTNKIRYDIIEAVLNGAQDDLKKIFQAATTLQQHTEDKDFKVSIEALTRVVNLAKKATEEAVEVDPALFENQSEQNLYDAIMSLQAEFTQLSLEEQYQALQGLRPLIESYFEETMVMVDDMAVRQNRLALLKKVATLVLEFASIDHLVVK